MDIFMFLSETFKNVDTNIINIIFVIYVLVSFIIGIVLNKKNLYVLLSFLGLSISSFIYTSIMYTQIKDCILFISFNISIILILYSVLCIVSFIKIKIRERREFLKEIERQAIFTLPDKENTFIKDRLKNSLNKADLPIEQNDYNIEEHKLSLEYVRTLLMQLKGAALTTSDRLETERLSRTITEYATKNVLNSKEVRALNNSLGAILKLSAKYSL